MFSSATRCVPSPFAPGVLGDVNGILGAIVAGTATNWPGFGYDPETHIAFMPAGNTPGVRSLVAPPGEFSDIRYVQGIAGQQFREVLGPGDCCAAGAPQTAERARAARNPATANASPPPGGFGGLNVQGLPISKPPYGMLAAIDLDKGAVEVADAAWRHARPGAQSSRRSRGSTSRRPARRRPRASVSLVTKTLVIMGDPVATTTPEHPRGAMLRAYDKVTGQQVGAVFMPGAAERQSPMTYMVDGKQYIVVAVSGGSYSGEYLAFSLPN